jgi:hypothetical protein
VPEKRKGSLPSCPKALLAGADVFFMVYPGGKRIGASETAFPETFPTTAAALSGFPETFPAIAAALSGFPETFPTIAAALSGFPETFPAIAAALSGNPETFRRGVMRSAGKLCGAGSSYII